MTYLVMDGAGHEICTAETLRRRIENGFGKIRIFRLVDLQDPKELYLRWFGNGYLICDRFGNNEGV